MKFTLLHTTIVAVFVVVVLAEFVQKLFFWFGRRHEMVEAVAHCHRLLVFLMLGRNYLVVEDRHAAGSGFLQGNFFVEVVVENGRHAVPPAGGKQTVLEVPDSFVHLPSAGLAAVFFFSASCQASLSMPDRLTLFPVIVKLHDFLLDFLLPVRFNQLNELLLLVIGCLSQNLNIIARGLALGSLLEGGWDGVSQRIQLVRVTIVAGRSGVMRLVHTPRKVNLGFGQD